MPTFLHHFFLLALTFRWTIGTAFLVIPGCKPNCGPFGFQMASCSTTWRNTNRMPFSELTSNSRSSICARLMQDPCIIDNTLRELYDWFGYETYGCDGYCTTDEENSRIDAVAGQHASGYGEITPAGFRELASDISLGETDVFFDLGSGVSA
jgi:hypothetical protein